MDETPILVDREALAAHFRVKVGTIDYWASKYKWTKHGAPRARLYDLAEATRSYHARRSERREDDGRAH